MTVIELYNKLEEMYPKTLSCAWDNDGLMCCPDKNKEVKLAVVALDATRGAIEYARKIGADVLFTHHPMIFRGIKQLTDDTVTSNRALTAYCGGISVISMHTRLDAGKGGVNDALAEILGLENVSIFGDAECPEIGRIGDLPSAMSADDFASYVKSKLGADFVRCCGDREVKRVAVVGGGGKDYIYPAMYAGADAFVTGEASYNAVIDAAEDGINVLEAGHYHTEQPVCKAIAKIIAELTGAKFEVYECNTTWSV